MKINWIGTIDNLCGLQRDYEIIVPLLRFWGHEVTGINVRENDKAPRADLNLFDEVPRPDLFFRADANWLLPHVEWYHDHWVPYLPFFGRILCKTAEAVNVMQRRVTFGWQLYRTDWCSKDLYRPEIKKERGFLHLAGGSMGKNTEATVLAWAFHKIPAPLTVISDCWTKESFQGLDLGNVRFLKRISEEDLIAEINRHQFHIMPSMYESWGHCIHEAMGCQGIILTTDAPPMSDFGTPYQLLVRSEEGAKHGLVNWRRVTLHNVYNAAMSALELSAEAIDRHSKDARERFLDDNGMFKRRFREVIDSA